MTRALLVLAAWHAACAQPATASQTQNQTPARPRPKIGLALAGGSALGLAHIGVLRWLDENRVPVDMVAGTSMGGLVGGFFATGASPGEIATFVRSIDWTAAFQSAPPFRQLHFRRKEDRREFPNHFDFGLKHGFRLPSALSPGHGVGLVLSQMTGPYADLESFDHLPTPFRTVAADMVEAKEVIFDRGDLFDALRATMSLPGIFAPVERGNQLLVDGGVLNNLPVDVTRKMGAGIVIAVALHAALPRKSGQYSVLDVASRSLDVMISGNELRSMAQADIVVIPDLAGFQSIEFARAEELIQRGYQAAAGKAAVLSGFALSESDYQAWLNQRRARRRVERFEPRFVQAEGLTPPLERNLESRLQPILDSQDRERLHLELTRLTGLGRWDTAHYRLVEENGRQGLLVKVHEKPHAPPILNTAIRIDSANSQPLRFGIAGRLTFLDTGGPGSEWRTDFALGIRDMVATEYFHRIRSSKVFVAPRVFYEKFTRDVYDGRDRVAQLRSRETGGSVDLGYAAGRFSEFRFGFAESRLRNRVSIGLPSLPSLAGGFRRLRARYVHEGQDSPAIATRGLRVAASGQWVFDAPGATRQFPVLEADLRWAVPLNDLYVLTMAWAGGTTPRNPNRFAPFGLGGPLRLSALAPYQLLGSHYYYGDAGVLRQIFKSRIPFFGRIYLSGSWEFGAAFDTGRHRGTFHDGAIGLVGETPIGVLMLGGAVGESGNRKVFFRLGRYF